MIETTQQNNTEPLLMSPEEKLLQGHQNQEELKAYFDTQNQEIEKYKKQAGDLRRKLSKGAVVPTAQEEYTKSYQPEDKYAPFYTPNPEGTDNPVNDFAVSVAGAIDKIAFDNGMTLQQTAAIKNAFNGLMDSLGVFETRSAQEIANAKEQWIQEEKQKLGDNADDMIKDSIAFYKNFNVLTDEDKALVYSLMGQGADAIKLFYHLKKALGGLNPGDDIPRAVGGDYGLADDRALAMEYNKTDTSDERRMQIIAQRKAAGRTGRLPFVA